MQSIDLKITKDTDGIYDIGIENGDFALIDSFDTSITCALLTDARADANEVLQSQRRRGWWGNQFASYFPDYQIGSKLWLLDQARNTQNTLNSAIDYARNALQWLVDDGHADNIIVNGTRNSSGISLVVQILRGNSIVDTKYYDLWQNSGAI